MGDFTIFSVDQMLVETKGTDYDVDDGTFDFTFSIIKG